MIPRKKSATAPLRIHGQTVEMVALGDLKTYAKNARLHPEDQLKARVGEVWLLGDHRLAIGDSTAKGTVERLLAGAVPHLMVTDPPYGVNYDPKWRSGIAGSFDDPRALGKVSNDGQADWRGAWELFPGDVAYAWCASLTSDAAIAALESAGLLRRSQIIWRKPHFQIGRGDYHWQHEPCWYVVRKGKSGHYVGDRKQTTVWDIAGLNPLGRGGKRKAENAETDHGTQKPVECMRRPILNNSKPGDFVYDPFCGSGTTLIACEMEGRNCLAIELDPIYAEVIITRWEAFAKKTAYRESDGKALADLRPVRKAA